ncbi:MAG TPA: RT0821/Lpp0805 family surface protein [Xanthobacteraceae bacterium]|nr:RT0821/Lpp0805 family surface protein [Xanthobacteraceae bacterium]
MARPWRLQSIQFGSIAAAVLLALPLGACAISYKLDALFGKDKDDPVPQQTSSIDTRPDAPSEAIEASADTSLRAAAMQVLTRGSKDVSVAWENPSTGARGTITPLSNAYSADGRECRDFLASYIHGQTESWLQGEGCRMREGRWEVRAMKPWKRT